MNSHRIIFAIYNANADGSVMSVTRRQAEFLAANGYKVTVVSNQCPSSWVGVETLQIPVLELWHWRALDYCLSGVSNRLPNGAKRLWNLHRFVPQAKFSAVVAKTLISRFGQREVALCICSQHFMAFGLKTLRDKCGTPYMLIAHGDVFTHPAASFSIPIQLLYKKAARFAYRTADHVIAVASFLAQRAESFGAKKERISVIANGVELAPKNEICPSSSSHDEKVIKLLFVGRLAPEKGLEVLLEAVDLIPGVDIHLRIVGDGYMESALRQQVATRNIGGRIELVGRVNHNDLANYYNQADLLVLPSFSEAFPLVMLEALACGLPVLATKVGGIPDVIENERNGFLVTPGNASQLASVIESVWKDKAKLPSMRKAAVLSASDYSWPAVLKQFEIVVGDTIKRTMVRVNDGI